MDKRIDVYIDLKNINNSWGIVSYKDSKLSRKKEEIVRFANRNNMVYYLQQYFNPQEVFFHHVDYDYVEYYYYKKQPNLNYIIIKYNESIKGKIKAKKLRLPDDFTEMFKSIMKTHKKMEQWEELDTRYYRSIDAKEKEINDRKEIVRSIKMSIEEFFLLAGDTIKKIDIKKILSKLKILVPTATLAVLLANGVNVVSDHMFYSRFISQTNPIKSLQDIGIYKDKGKAGAIIEKLIEDNYDEVSKEDMDYVIEFIKRLDSSNYDNNASYSVYNFSDFFGDIAYKDGMNAPVVRELLKKIESLYNHSIAIVDGKTFIRQEEAKKYLDFVCSLTFMYDTYHTNRPKSYVEVNTQSVYSPYANKEQIAAYDKFPEILKNIILNQAKGLLKRTTYEVDQVPSYYFGSTDKYQLLLEIDKRIDLTVDLLYMNCKNNDENKTI